MKYKLKYSLPYDIYRYAMQAKDQAQLATFVKMLVEEKAYGIEVVPEYVWWGNEVEDDKILIIWETKLDNGHIDKRQIECNYERTARFLYDTLAALDKTVSIRLEYLTND